MTATRWLVTGAGGQIGSDVVAVLRTYNEIVVACDHHALDVTSPIAVRTVLDDARPDVVVHCAGYTGDDEQRALHVNTDGIGLVATWCRDNSARVLYVSTGDVFDGETSSAYDENAATAPVSMYARSMAAGERAVVASGAEGYVVRTSWVYGAIGENMVKTIARQARGGGLRIDDDAIGAPTWSLHLARGMVALGASNARPGVYHCTNDGEASWYVVARAVLAEMGLDPSLVEPADGSRPAHTILDNGKWAAAALPRMAHWRDALHEAFVAVGDELTGRE